MSIKKNNLTWHFYINWVINDSLILHISAWRLKKKLNFITVMLLYRISVSNWNSTITNWKDKLIAINIDYLYMIRLLFYINKMKAFLTVGPLMFSISIKFYVRKRKYRLEQYQSCQPTVGILSFFFCILYWRRFITLVAFCSFYSTLMNASNLLQRCT